MTKIIILCFSLIGIMAFKCKERDRSRYIVRAIDSTCFKMYYHLTITRVHNKVEVHLLSDKEYGGAPNIFIGDKICIELDTLRTIRIDSIANMRTFNTMHICDEKTIIEAGVPVYSSPQINGLIYKK